MPSVPEPSSSVNPVLSWFKTMLNKPNDSQEKTLFVAVALCLVCAILVSASAVLLRPIQQSNQALDRKQNILRVAGLLSQQKSGQSVEDLFNSRIRTRIINLKTGEYADDIDPKTYDQRKAAGDPKQSINLDKATDIAGISRRANYATVYHVMDGDQLSKLILPVHGYGLWSTMYAFVAITPDASEILDLSFYEQKETPGLGGEVENPDWQKKWHGKQIFDENGSVRIEVIKGQVDNSKSAAKYQVDGLAGATLTSRGVSNMFRFWMGNNGFKPYLEHLKARTSM